MSSVMDEQKTLRIGVLSDTHLSGGGEAVAFLHDLVEYCLAPFDMILYAGDLFCPGLLDIFGNCPVHAVRGNMDPATPGIPIKKLLDVRGFSIGMMHGWGPPQGLEQRILNEFAGTRLDCLVYGHSHRPVCTVRDGLLILNPGSATDRRGMPFHSVGLIEIGERMKGSIIRID